MELTTVRSLNLGKMLSPTHISPRLTLTTMGEHSRAKCGIKFMTNPFFITVRSSNHGEKWCTIQFLTSFNIPQLKGSHFLSHPLLPRATNHDKILHLNVVINTFYSSEDLDSRQSSGFQCQIILRISHKEPPSNFVRNKFVGSSKLCLKM